MELDPSKYYHTFFSTPITDQDDPDTSIFTVMLSALGSSNFQVLTVRSSLRTMQPPPTAEVPEPAVQSYLVNELLEVFNRHTDAADELSELDFQLAIVGLSLIVSHDLSPRLFQADHAVMCLHPSLVDQYRIMDVTTLVLNNEVHCIPDEAVTELFNRMREDGYVIPSTNWYIEDFCRIAEENRQPPKADPPMHHPV